MQIVRLLDEDRKRRGGVSVVGRRENGDAESAEPGPERSEAEGSESGKSHTSSTNRDGQASANKHENTLLDLTKRFLQLIESNESSVVDLNQAAEQLGVAKRRIYDITNVLEGIELIEKCQKNKVIWKGNTKDSTLTLPMGHAKERRHIASSHSLKKLTEEEKELDKLIELAQSELVDFQKSREYLEFGYVSESDLERALNSAEHDIVAVTAAKGSKLEVGTETRELVIRSRDDLVLHILSHSGGVVQHCDHPLSQLYN